MYVGTYTGESSEGIYVMKFDAEDGTITPIDTVRGIANPSYLALSPDNQFLYAVSEMADSADAAVYAYRVDRGSGSLTLINRQSSYGGAPCYINVDNQGNNVAVGNYLGGSLSVFSVGSDGSLEESATVIKHQGSSQNLERQQSAHVHCTLFAPDNQNLFVSDLGTDRLQGYAYDAEARSLNETPQSVFEADPGSGPRHLTFHPNGKFAYLINELKGTIVAFRYLEGTLEPIQTVSTLPEEYEGSKSGADIHVSPDGKFLYASNREDLNNIVIFSINEEEGSLTKRGEVSSGGVHPRNFVLDPEGRYLLAANRHTDNIVVFERDGQSGMLNATGEEAAVSQPVCLKMVPMP